MKQHIKIFLIAFTYFAIISYINEWLAINQPNFYNYFQPLKDYGHDTLPPITSKISDIMLLIFIIYFFIKSIFVFKNINIITVFFFIMGTIFFMRLLSFNVTHLPFIWKDCENKNFWQRRFFFIYDTKSCGDYMFSGHAAYFILIALFILYLNSNHIENIITTIFALIGIITIIGGRLHYSVDVCIAIFLTILSFYSYKYLSLNPYIKKYNLNIFN